MFWNLLLEATGGGTTGGTTGGDTAGTTGGNNLGSIIMLVVIVVALIGMFVWQTISNKKKQKEAKNLLDNIKVGDRVKTIGGICGFIAEIRESDNTFVLETGLDTNKCFIRFDKNAIYQTAPEGTVEPVKEEVKVEKVEEVTAEVVEDTETEDKND